MVFLAGKNSESRRERAEKTMSNPKKNLIYNILIAICAVVFLVSGGKLGFKLYEERKQQAAFDRMADVFEEPNPTDLQETRQEIPAGEGQQDEAVPGPLETLEERYLSRLAGYETLHERNSDFVGWIQIEGTKIDYPVVQSKDRPDYYLKRNFERENSAYGTPYLMERCELGEPGTNLLLYGHHMKNGSMFAALEGYRDAEFYQEHPYIRFDTLSEASLYEVAGAWLIPNAASADYVEELYALLFPGSEEEFLSGWNAAGRRLYVNRGIELEYEDKLIALVTCDYSYNDSRIVVLGRKLDAQ